MGGGWRVCWKMMQHYCIGAYMHLIVLVEKECLSFSAECMVGSGNIYAFSMVYLSGSQKVWYLDPYIPLLHRINQVILYHFQR